MTTRMLHPGQMSLFMRPEQIKRAVFGSLDVDLGETMRGMWARKEEESKVEPRDPQVHGSGVYKSLLTEQVREPVELQVTTRYGEPGLVMGPGHHRVAAAHAVERASRGQIQHWIPVEYEEY